MQRWTKFLTAAGAAVLISSQAIPALAQPPGGGRGRGGFGFGGGGMFGGGGQTNVFSILQSEDVQKELAITEDQKTKAKTLGDEVRTAIGEIQRPEFSRGEGGPSEESMKAFAEYRTKTTKVIDDKKAALAAILSADQVKRLDEIVLQAKGVDALMEADVQAKLMLTDEQKSKLTSVNREIGEKQREAMRAAFQGDRDAAQEKMATMRKERTTALEAVLTPAQGEQWEMMKGKEVANIDAIRRSGFGGGRGGPGGPGGGRGGDRGGPGRPQRPATDN